MFKFFIQISILSFSMTIQPMLYLKAISDQAVQVADSKLASSAAFESDLRKKMHDYEEDEGVIKQLSLLEPDVDTRFSYFLTLAPLIAKESDNNAKARVLKAAIEEKQVKIIPLILHFGGMPSTTYESEELHTFFKALFSQHVALETNNTSASLKINDPIVEMIATNVFFPPNISNASHSFQIIFTCLLILNRLKPVLPKNLIYMILAQPPLRTSLCEAFLHLRRFELFIWEPHNLKKFFSSSMPYHLASGVFSYFEETSQGELIKLLCEAQNEQINEADSVRVRLSDDILNKRRITLSAMTGIQSLAK